jgi:hypothetical protein
MSSMAVDAVLVLQRSDVAAIEQQRERFAGVPLLCIDPGIADAVLQAGLPDYQLRRLDVPRSLCARAYTQAMTKAAAIDLALTHERELLFGSDLALHGWDQMLLYLTLQRAYTQQALGRLVERSFPEARLGLLRPDNPALFHWDAMLYPEIVGADQARWSIVARYAQARQWNPVVLDAVFDSQGLAARLGAAAATSEAGAIALTHLATCFYDGARFAAAIEAAFAQVIDLPGAYCDVPVARTGAPLLRALQAGDLDLPCLRYEERAAAVFEDGLRDLIPNRVALLQQARCFARRGLLQAVAFTGLRKALAARPAGRELQLVLADHDTGFQGPLFSAAAEAGASITVLPHSAYPTSVLPHAERVTAVELDGVGVPVRSVLGTPVGTRAVRFRPAVQAAARPAAKRVCLLLNTMLAEGLSQVELFALMPLQQALAALCERHGATLEVRAKPGAPALGVLAGALRLPPAALAASMGRPLADAAQDADLCIAFGEPTSATSAFLDAGSLVLHTSELDWPADYVLTTPLVGSLIQSLRSSETLAAVERLLSDPAHYRTRLLAQATRHAARRAGAHSDLFPVSPSATAAPTRRAMPATAPQELAPC